MKIIATIKDTMSKNFFRFIMLSSSKDNLSWTDKQIFNKLWSHGCAKSIWQFSVSAESAGVSGNCKNLSYYKLLSVENKKLKEFSGKRQNVHTLTRQILRNERSFIKLPSLSGKPHNVHRGVSKIWNAVIWIT